ncbi:hypothetical protein ACTAB2_13120 [Pseudomonas syringae]|uniref:hypothetical protein n=1 Tax=Pseudomonas syringae TaxID=317 RepID=UPI003F797A26
MTTSKGTNATYLRPFASFLLYEWDTPPTAPMVAAALAGLQAPLTSTLPLSMRVVDGISVKKLSGVAASAFYVVHHSRPAWTNDPSVVDVMHHTVILLSYKRYLGVVVSDHSLRLIVERELANHSTVKKLDSDELENALVRETPLRTLWLRSAHRPNRRKADSKVLIGQYLQEALNPLDDRTFTSPSMRAEAQLNPVGKASVVGVTTQRSYVWLGPCQSFAELQNLFKSLADYLTQRRSTQRQAIPVLAKSMTQSPKVGDAFQAFDFSFLASYAIAGLDQPTLAALEHAEADLSIETVGSADQNFTLAITDAHHPNSQSPQGLWHVVVEVKLGATRTTVSASLNGNSASWPSWGVFKILFDQKHLWSVWYESGQTFSDGDWVCVDPRNSAYDGEILPVTFNDKRWEVSQEKPLLGRSVQWDDIANSTDRSLFSWWIHEGYAFCFPSVKGPFSPGEFALALCDDGAGEIGDFIMLVKHAGFATKTNPSSLAVIVVHLKGAANSKKRAMAPKQYEEVLGQATKNLSWMHLPDLATGLKKDLMSGKNLLWSWNGQVFDRVLQHKQKLAKSAPQLKMLDEFDGRRAHSFVIVVQPHQDADDFISAMAKSPVDYKTRLLSTLLCAADGACRGSSATLKVVMSKT